MADNTYTVKLEDGSSWDVHSPTPLSDYDAYMSAKTLSRQATKPSSKLAPVSPLAQAERQYGVGSPEATRARIAATQQGAAKKGIKPAGYGNNPLAASMSFIAEADNPHAQPSPAQGQYTPPGGWLPHPPGTAPKEQISNQSVMDSYLKGTPKILAAAPDPIGLNQDQREQREMNPEGTEPFGEHVAKFRSTGGKNLSQVAQEKWAELGANEYQQALAGMLGGTIDAPFDLAEAAVNGTGFDPNRPFPVVAKTLGSMVQGVNVVEPGISGPERLTRAINLAGMVVPGMLHGAPLETAPDPLGLGLKPQGEANAVPIESPTEVPIREEAEGSGGIRQQNPALDVQEPARPRGPGGQEGTQNVQEEVQRGGTPGSNEPAPPSEKEVGANNAQTEPPLTTTEIPHTPDIEGKTGLANRVQAAMVEAGRIAPPEKGVTISDAEAHLVGKMAVESGRIDPEELALKIATEKRPFSAEEGGALLEGSRRLENLVDAKGEELDAAIANGDDATVLSQEYIAAKQRLQDLLDNVQKGKTEWSNTGRAMRAGSTLDEGSYTQILREFQRRAGRLATPEEDTLSKNLAFANRKIAELQAKNAAGDVVRSAPRGPRFSKADLDAELDDILNQAGTAFKAIAHGKAGVGIDLTTAPDLAKQIGRLGLNYAKRGINDLDAIVAKIQETINAKFGLDLTSRQIHDAISGYGKEPTTRSEAEARVNELKAEAALRSRLEDAKAGTLKPGKTQKGSPKNIDIASQVRIQKQIKFYEDQIESGNFTKPVKPPPRIQSKELQAAIRERDAIKVRWLRAQEPKVGFVQGVITGRKAGLVSSPRTYAKIAVANTASAVMDTAAKQIGGLVDAALSSATGNLRTYGVGDVNAVAGGVQSAATKGMADAMQILKTGVSPDQLLQMQFPREMNTGIKAIDGPINAVFRSHGALYQPFREFALKKSLLEQAHLNSAKLGRTVEDLINNPTKEMADQALRESDEAVFLNPNQLSKQIGNAKRMPVAGPVIDFAVPFDKVPTNIVGRIAEHGVGAPYEAAKGISRAYQAKGAKGLASDAFRLRGKELIKAAFPDQASQAAFAKAVGRNALGVPLIYLGYKLAQKGIVTAVGSITGGSSAKDTREATGVQEGAIKVGDHWFRIADSIPGLLMTMGAGVNSDDPQGKAQWLESVGRQLLRESSNLPMLEGVDQLSAAARNPAKEGPKYLQSAVTSFIPKIIQDTAQVTDPESTRAVEGYWDSIKNALPGARETLPVKHDAFGRPAQSPSAFDPFRTLKENPDPAVQAVIKYELHLTRPTKFNESTAAFEARLAKWGPRIADNIRQAISSEGYKNEKSKTARIEYIKDAIHEGKADISDITPHVTRGEATYRKVMAERKAQ